MSAKNILKLVWILLYLGNGIAGYDAYGEEQFLYVGIALLLTFPLGLAIIPLAKYIIAPLTKGVAFSLSHNLSNIVFLVVLFGFGYFQWFMVILYVSSKFGNKATGDEVKGAQL